MYVYIYICVSLQVFLSNWLQGFPNQKKTGHQPPAPSTPRPRGSAALRDAIRQQLAAFDLTWLPRVGETVGSGGWFLFGFSPANAAVGWFLHPKRVFFVFLVFL